MSGLSGMLTSIIRHTFLEQGGKHQIGRGKTPKAMQIRMRKLNHLIDGEAEDGRREYELLLYAPGNYVQVYTRETWDVIPSQNLVYNQETDEEEPAPGCKYEKGASPWRMIADHDSCWTDPIERFFDTHKLEITMFTGSGWFRWIPVEDLKLVEALHG